MPEAAKDQNFVLFRGLDELYVAEVQTDNNEIDGGYTTGTPEKLIPAGEMSVSPDSEVASVFYDNSVYASVGREGSTEITISGAGLRAAMSAKLNAKDIDEDTGAVMDSGTFTEKYWAFGGRKKGLDGSYEYFWFSKGTFSIPEESAKTEDDSTDTNGTDLTYTAIQTIHKFTKTGKVSKRVVMSDATTGKTKQVDFSKWFTQVVTPDNIPTVEE